MSDDAHLLVAYARKGDVRALSAFVKGNASWLQAYLRGLLSNDCDADDAMQDVWVRVIRSCRGYRGGSPRAYLVRTARSVVIDRFRRNGRPMISLDDPDNEGMSRANALVDESLIPSAYFELCATAADVRAAVASLPIVQRDVLLMRIEGELPFREIAAIQGVPLGTVLTRMRNAVVKLKDKLGGLR